MYSTESPVRYRHRAIQKRQNPQSPSKTNAARSGGAGTLGASGTTLLYY